MEKKTLILIISIIVLFFYIVLKPIFDTPHLFTHHDFPQVARVHEMTQALKDGQFPVRFSTRLGYGYGMPLFNFYAPFPYYIGALFALVGTTFIDATKWMIVVGFVSSFFTMYVLAKRIWNVKVGLICALIYTFAPYHAVQMYVRGSFSEMFAYGFLPLVILGIYEITTAIYQKGKINRKLVGTALIGTSFFLQSHTLSIYMLSVTLIPLLLVLFIISAKHGKTTLLKWCAGIGLFLSVSYLSSSYVIVPAMTEISYTRLSLERGNEINYRDHFITYEQLWDSPWGYGLSWPGTKDDGMSFFVGKFHIVAAVTGYLIVIFVYLQHKKKNNLYLAISFISAGYALFCAYLMTESSLWLWESIPRFNIIQLPWRFLMYLTCVLTLLTGGGLYYLFMYLQKIIPPNMKQPGFVVALIACCYLLYNPLSNPHNEKYTVFVPNNEYWQYSETDWLSEGLLDWFASRTDDYLPKNTPRISEGENISRGEVTCEVDCQTMFAEYKSNIYLIGLTSSISQTVTINKAYYPGFIAYVNDKPAPIKIDATNNMQVEIANGYNEIVFKFTETTTRMISNSITLLALLVMGIYTFEYDKAFRKHLKI